MKNPFTYLWLLFLPLCSYSQVLPQDSLALVALFNSTSGENWDWKQHWLQPGAPVGWWYGIEVQNERVIRIDLDNNNLVGAIPGEIGNLDSLRFLDLGADTIYSLPSAIGNLTTLDTLGLFAAFIDTLPPQIGYLQDLKYLDFDYTQVRYLPDEIGGLTKLEVLSGNHGKLRNIPETIGNCTALKIIDLQVNEITNLPVGIGNCTELTELHLNRNLIPVVPDEIGNLTNLTRLILGGNELNDLPGEIFTLTNLTHLNFAANHIDSIPESIGNLIQLRNFQFFDNEIVNFPVEIVNLLDLGWIYGYSNKIDALPAGLIDLPIVAMNLGENSLSFEDIEPLVTISDFHYYDQDSLGRSIDTIIYVNSAFRLECITGGEHNLYQWLKNEDTLDGATKDYYEFSSLAFSDSGVYRCVVNNSLVTDLTLYSRPVNLHVINYSGTNDNSTYETGSLNVFPNPSKGCITVSYHSNYNEEFRLRITSNNSNVLIDETCYFSGGSFEKLFDLSYADPGLYFIVIQQNKRIWRKKFILCEP